MERRRCGQKDQCGQMSEVPVGMRNSGRLSMLAARGSEREIGRNVGNEVRPSDLAIHDENFQWHCKWEMTGEVCGAGLCTQGLMECLSEEVRGS